MGRRLKYKKEVKENWEMDTISHFKFGNTGVQFCFSTTNMLKSVLKYYLVNM